MYMYCIFSLTLSDPGGALASAFVHPSYFEGIGASGAVHALEACNCLLQPQRLYVWAGMKVTGVQLLGSRLCLDVVSSMQCVRVDYAAHLGGAAAGALYWHLYLRVESSGGEWGGWT
jgi:membrane associated rhomboid family serine protease